MFSWKSRNWDLKVPLGFYSPLFKLNKFLKRSIQRGKTIQQQQTSIYMQPGIVFNCLLHIVHHYNSS